VSSDTIIARGPFATTCSAKAEQRGNPVTVARMMGLDTAAGMLGGKPTLARALAIEDRTLRYKLTGDRGVSRADLLAAAAALDTRAARIADHARKLRDEAGDA